MVLSCGNGKGCNLKVSIALLATLWGHSAAAHPGHLIEAAGHDHWVAGIAIGAAIAVGIWGALKGEPKEETEDEPEELQEA